MTMTVKRPGPKPSLNPLDVTMRVRMTQDQKAAQIAAAKRSGLSWSNWIRRLGDREAGLSPVMVDSD
jgi:hypothetical protein